MKQKGLHIELGEGIEQHNLISDNIIQNLYVDKI